MKKIIFCFLFLVTVVHLFCQSCDFTNQKTIVTNTLCTLATALQNADQTLAARDAVTLNAGFTLSNATSHKLTVTTDHTIVPTNVDYLASSSIVTGATRTLDKNNFAPGTIGGSMDIGASGAATYQIPIQVSPGTMGMQPNLGIVYSSQSGNDILGYGWHLTGLSAITRVNKNIYYDGTVAPVTLTSSDVFALDGQRLIANPNVANTFSPENDPYTYVTFNGSVFTVTTKDGMVMEYGNNYNNNNSQFIAGGSSVPYDYGLDKTTDPNGNYVEYIYTGTNSSGEYHISTINYTGNSNSGAKPYNSVYFYYTKRTDTNTAYIAGGSVTSSTLLTEIQVLAEGNLSKDYKFTYITPGNDNDQVTKLNQILYSGDGVIFTPTVINYGASSDNTATLNEFDSNMNTNLVYFGDFNGDGKTDYALWNKSNYIEVYINGGACKKHWFSRLQHPRWYIF